MRRLFLSDVHLSPRHPERTARLLAVWDREAPRTQELYILGDLFDYWIGPKHLVEPDYREVLAKLRGMTERGPRVFFLLGNRDFYMEGFEQATGVQVVRDRTEHWLRAGSKRVYLCHGDYLGDRRGLEFRMQEFFRSRGVEKIYTGLPAWLGKLGARFYRWVSERQFLPARYRPTTRPGLSDRALAERFRRGADVIVCGHVHRAEMRTMKVRGREGILFALGDWSQGPSYLVEEDGQFHLYEGPAL